MDVFQNMELFSELIQCGGNIYTWCYNADGSLLQSNCPEVGFLSGAFEIFGCKKKMLDYGSRHTTPVTLGTAIGMTWAAAFEKDGSAPGSSGRCFIRMFRCAGLSRGCNTITVWKRAWHGPCSCTRR